MNSVVVPDICLKRAIKAFTKACPHLSIQDKPITNEELEF